VGRTTNKQRRASQAATARERAAAARAAQLKTEQRQRAMRILGSVVAVAVVIAVVAVVAITHKTKNSASGNRIAALSSVSNAVTHVSDATLNQVGDGAVQAHPTAVTGQPPLTANGKPELLYIGAEFCPFCAVERWAIAESLSKFGTLSNLSEVRSANTDGNYASLDFYKSSYTSKYLTFTPVENEDRNRKQLQAVSSAQAKLWNTLDQGRPSFPFLDFGNKLAITLGSPLNPSVLGTMTQQQIAQQLDNPSTAVAKAIGGEANDITASICTMTNNKPSSVCSASVIKGIQTKIASGSSSSGAGSSSAG
jgi:hypothetical protein